MDIEAFAIAAGMDSALNLGSGSCVSSDGCHGVTQDHLERFSALVQAAERERWLKAAAAALDVLDDLPAWSNAGHACQLLRECVRPNV